MKNFILILTLFSLTNAFANNKYNCTQRTVNRNTKNNNKRDYKTLEEYLAKKARKENTSTRLFNQPTPHYEIIIPLMLSSLSQNQAARDIN